MVCALACAGCFSSLAAVKERAGKEYRCTEVQVEELGGNAYRAQACGQSAIYVCSASMGFCMKESGAAAAAPASYAAPAPMPAATMPAAPPMRPAAPSYGPPPPGYGPPPAWPR
jgi:hypothetical protein